MAERAGVGSILSQTFALAARNALALFGLALLFAALTRALDWAAFGSDPFVFLPIPAPKRIDPLLAEMLQQCADELIQLGVSAAMLWLLLSGTTSRYAHSRDGAGVIDPLVAYCLILWGVVSVTFVLQYVDALHPSTPATFAGAAATVVWGVATLYASIALWVTVPVIIVERLEAFAAFKRSWALTKGNRGAIFGVVLVLLAGTTVPILLLRSAGGYSLTHPLPIPLWSPVGAVSLLLQLSIIVLFAASTAVFYWELRKVKDGA